MVESKKVQHGNVAFEDLRQVSGDVAVHVDSVRHDKRRDAVPKVEQLAREQS